MFWRTWTSHLEGLVGVRGHRHGSACHLVLHEPGLVSSYQKKPDLSKPETDRRWEVLWSVLSNFHSTLVHSIVNFFFFFQKCKNIQKSKTRNRHWYQSLTVVLTKYEGVHAPQSKHIQEVPGRRAHPAHSGESNSKHTGHRDRALRDTYTTNTDK